MPRKIRIISSARFNFGFQWYSATRIPPRRTAPSFPSKIPMNIQWRSFLKTRVQTTYNTCGYYAPTAHAFCDFNKMKIPSRFECMALRASLALHVNEKLWNYCNVEFPGEFTYFYDFNVYFTYLLKRFIQLNSLSKTWRARITGEIMNQLQVFFLSKFS